MADSILKIKQLHSKHQSAKPCMHMPGARYTTFLPRKLPGCELLKLENPFDTWQVCRALCSHNLHLKLKNFVRCCR